MSRGEDEGGDEQRVLGFGRFRRLTLREIWATDPSYVAWLYRTFHVKSLWFVPDVRNLLDTKIEAEVVDAALSAVAEALVDVVMIEACVEVEERKCNAQNIPRCCSSSSSSSSSASSPDSR